MWICMRLLKIAFPCFPRATDPALGVMTSDVDRQPYGELDVSIGR